MNMDEGPFRMPPRPADRSATNRPEPTPRPREEPQPVKEEPKPVHRAPSPRHSLKEEKSSKRFLLPIIVGIGIVIVLVVGFFIWSNTQPKTAIDGGKYQAVFFTNGQVYFGKLQAFNTDYMRLTDVYYLQSATGEEADPKNPQQTAANQGSPTLIKLGDEIHGPEDAMIISKDQILFYENLKSDGSVSKSIDQDKNPN